MTVRETMERLAKENGAVLSDKADKIIQIKERSIDEYSCPCHKDKEHYCISQLCKTHLFTEGVCQCGLFMKR